MSDDEFAVY